MSKRFITFKPVTGIFTEAIRPYKKWYELADMSPPVEVDGEYYRILRTTGSINKVNTRKMVVCDEGGRLIKDAPLSQKCIEIFHYLDAYEMNSQAIVLSSKDDTPTKLEEFILEFKKMVANVTHKLTEEEIEAMNRQLDYYEKTKHYSEIVAESASVLASYIEPLKENKIERFSASFIEKLGNDLNDWEENKRYIQALLIENDKKTRDRVKQILREPSYQSFFPNRQIKSEMESEMLQAEMSVKRFIHDGKHGWEREKKYVNPDKGKFNLEIYLDQLWNRNNADVYMNIHKNEFIHDYWLFSKSRLHN